jgi:signal peptidase I
VVSAVTEPIRRSTRRRTTVIVVASIVVLLAISIGISAALRSTFRGWYIPSEAMTPTLEVGDHVLSEELSYHLHDPRRGDIVVFDAPPAARTPLITTLVKRIVGMPGDVIAGRGGAIYIDGKRLPEPYLPAHTESRTFGPLRVPDHSYFMLGDNRQYSKDSTFFGPIARDAIVGRVFLRYRPLSRFGTL